MQLNIDTVISKILFVSPGGHLVRCHRYNRYLIVASSAALAGVTSLTAQLQLQLSVSSVLLCLFVYLKTINKCRM